jgi:hypothetical protein
MVEIQSLMLKIDEHGYQEKEDSTFLLPHRMFEVGFPENHSGWKS